MITIYVYNKDSGEIVSEVSGMYKDVTSDIPETEDFTLTPPPDYVRSWRWLNTEWVAGGQETNNIAKLQEQVWSDIKDKRLLEFSAGVFVPSVGKRFDTDERSLAKYSEIAGMIALDNYTPIDWKTSDNTWLTLTVPLFKELQRTVSANTNRIYAVAEKHKTKMMQVSDPLVYDFSDKWQLEPIKQE